MNSIKRMMILITVLLISLWKAWGAKPQDPKFERDYNKNMCKDARKITCIGGDYDLKCMCSRKECYWSCNHKFWVEIEKEWNQWNIVNGKSQLSNTSTKYEISKSEVPI